MGRFVFSLEAVLGYRKRLEEEELLRFSERNRELVLAQTELARLNDEFRRQTSELREDHRSFGAEDLSLRYAHLQFLDRSIDAQLRTVEERRLAVEEARGRLTEVRKNRKVVDRLRERREDEFIAEELRRDQKELDDVNGRSHGRSSRKRGSL